MIILWFPWHFQSPALSLSHIIILGALILTASWQELPAAALVSGECQLQLSRYQAVRRGSDPRWQARRQANLVMLGRVRSQKEGLRRAGGGRQPPERGSGAREDPSHAFPAPSPTLLSNHCPHPSGESVQQVRQGPGQGAQVQTCLDPRDATLQSLRDLLHTEEQVPALRASVPLRMGKQDRPPSHSQMQAAVIISSGPTQGLGFPHL